MEQRARGGQVSVARRSLGHPARVLALESNADIAPAEDGHASECPVTRLLRDAEHAAERVREAGDLQRGSRWMAKPAAARETLSHLAHDMIVRRGHHVARQQPFGLRTDAGA